METKKINSSYLESVFILEPSKRRAWVKQVINSLNENIRLLNDGSGRIVYLRTNEISFSPFINLFHYFFDVEMRDNLVIPKGEPIDSDKFMNFAIKPSHLPAKYIRLFRKNIIN